MHPEDREYIHLFLFIITPLSLLLFSCALSAPEPCIRDGHAYGVTDDLVTSHDWDSSYRRGLSYAEGGCWEEAIEQFNQAINQRHADQWRARSYGMHVLDEYFPHRELGIVYLEKGDPAKAAEELKISLSTADSGKAKYFLNKANRLLLEDGDIDHTPREIHFKDPGNKRGEMVYTNQSTYQIQGEVTDDFFVSSIVLEGRRVYLDLARPKIPFIMDVQLKQGKNSYLCQARDLVDNRTRKEVKIFLDQKGPIVLFSIEYTHEDLYKTSHIRSLTKRNEMTDNLNDYTDPPGIGKSLLLKGLIYDRVGLERFSIGEKDIPIDYGETIKEFQEELHACATVKFIAGDIAGNCTAGELDMAVECNRMEQTGSVNPVPYVPYDCGRAWERLWRMAGETTYGRGRETPYRMISVTPYGRTQEIPYGRGNERAWLAESGKDTVRPFRIASNNPVIPLSGHRIPEKPSISDTWIEIKYPPITYEPSIYITGRVKFDKEIKEIKINDDSVFSYGNDTGILDYIQRIWFGERTVFYFTRHIDGLKRGGNRVVITATDGAGEIYREEIEVEYRIRKIEETGNRWRLAIIRFDIHSLQRDFLMDPRPCPLTMVRDDVQYYFEKSGRFRLLEREHIDRIMEELGIASSSMVDKSTGPQMGRLLAAEVLLLGSVSERWDKRQRCLEISARLVDVETSEQLATINVFNVWGSGDEEYLLQGLADMFKKEFPLLQGRVLSKKGYELELNLTRSDLLKRGMKIWVYRPPLEDENILGEAKVKRVSENSSQTSPLHKEIAERIKIDDMIITK